MKTAASQDRAPVALVTGGTTRVGAAIAHHLCRAGWRVVLTTSRTTSEPAAFAAQIHAELVHCDLRRPLDARNAVAAAMERVGRIDALINNAALFYGDDASLVDIATMKAVNVDGPRRLFSALLPSWSDGGGAVVNIGDIAAFRPLPGYRHYSKTKKELVAWTRDVAAAHAQAGIRANAVCPGLVLAHPGLDGPAEAALRAKVPLPVAGDPYHVAQAVAFFLECAFATGQVLCVDGGRLARLQQGDPAGS